MREGFSLVELSIVLVILGLLTGGILGGQNLIRAAELRSVVSDYQRYLAATQSFRDKYMAIPGDMPNATRFWGDNNAACADAAITNGNPGTCNGDGDGLMDVTTGANTTGERFQFWNQLSLGGLIEGSFTGLAGAGGVDHCVLGANCMSSRMGNGGWSVVYDGGGGSTNAYNVDYGNRFDFGAASTTANTLGAILKPEEAWNIDTKLDDGKPAYGKVIARYWNNACAAADDGSSANSDLVASYRLSDGTTQCALHFRNAF